METPHLIITKGKCFTCGENSELEAQIEYEVIPFCKKCAHRYGDLLGFTPNWREFISAIAHCNAERDAKAGFKISRSS